MLPLFDSSCGQAPRDLQQRVGFFGEVSLGIPDTLWHWLDADEAVRLGIGILAEARHTNLERPRELY